jgi:hypothetical protein
MAIAAEHLSVFKRRINNYVRRMSQVKRSLLCFGIIALLIFNKLPLIAAQQDAFEDYLPIRTGMKLTFNYIIAHVEQKKKTWNLSVVKESFPESLTYTWSRPAKSGQTQSGTRILTDLKASRDFNPWYKTNESKATTDTAPWVSIQVLKELREGGAASNFREGGSGAINWAATDLRLKEKVIFPVFINGKPEALHAFRVNKGMVIWNNLKNPLVLEYEPLGIPLLTSVTGWKLTSINY